MFKEAATLRRMPTQQLEEQQQQQAGVAGLLATSRLLVSG
jgi:hypothetical protein